MPLISSFYGVLIYLYWLDTRHHRLVQAWIEIHRDELQADWSLAVQGQPVFKIDPLN